ncbi:MAG: ribosome small subunit-dependent GTPase A [bacterium]|nr:ribosome small subunit-dependent GTPase A [bacterium]
MSGVETSGTPVSRDGLEAYGWSPHFEALFAPHRSEGREPARVVQEHRGLCTLRVHDGELDGEVAGRFRHDIAEGVGMVPAIGDWVAIKRVPDENKAVIHAVLDRRGRFSRMAPGSRTQEQVLAANVDVVFLVCGLDNDFNPRRIERYVTTAWESGATPVVVLNKADVCPDIDTCIAEVEAVAFGVPVFAVSATTGDGIARLREEVAFGKTAAFLGSSGVGKSSIINALLGESRQATGDVREDDSRGRHTTTHREVIALADGGLVIDTPGLRELQLWADGDGLGQAFGDVEALAEQCRFRDCRHEAEPGCAIRQALEDGSLDQGRYRSYQKLQRELAYAAKRQEQGARQAEKTRWKKIAVLQKQMYRDRNKGR